MFSTPGYGMLLYILYINVYKLKFSSIYELQDCKIRILINTNQYNVCGVISVDFSCRGGEVCDR